MDLPDFGLALAYWLHIVATVTWVGGLIALSVLVIPAARRTLQPGDYAALLDRLQAGLQRVGWLSLAVLIATGMFQMSAHPAYEGFLAISNAWSVAILIKHILIGFMVLAGAYLTWGIMPSLRRMALLRAAGQNLDAAKDLALRKRESRVLTINLILSILVLLLTAIARAA
ncbi:MAG: CopD family protein [Bellilinea sp.]